MILSLLLLLGVWKKIGNWKHGCDADIICTMSSHFWSNFIIEQSKTLLLSTRSVYAQIDRSPQFRVIFDPKTTEGLIKGGLCNLISGKCTSVTTGAAVKALVGTLLAGVVTEMTLPPHGIAPSLTADAATSLIKKPAGGSQYKYIKSTCT